MEKPLNLKVSFCYFNLQVMCTECCAMKIEIKVMKDDPVKEILRLLQFFPAYALSALG